MHCNGDRGSTCSVLINWCMYSVHCQQIYTVQWFCANKFGVKKVAIILVGSNHGKILDEVSLKNNYY